MSRNILKIGQMIFVFLLLYFLLLPESDGSPRYKDIDTGEFISEDQLANYEVVPSTPTPRPQKVGDIPGYYQYFSKNMLISDIAIGSAVGVAIGVVFGLVAWNALVTASKWAFWLFADPVQKGAIDFYISNESLQFLLSQNPIWIRRRKIYGWIGLGVAVASIPVVFYLESLRKFGDRDFVALFSALIVGSVVTWACVSSCIRWLAKRCKELRERP